MVRTVCIDPHNVKLTSPAFGALLLANEKIKGAQTLQVKRGSIAGSRGVEAWDIVFEFAGRRIVTAEELQTAVSYTAAGSRMPADVVQGSAGNGYGAVLKT